MFKFGTTPTTVDGVLEAFRETITNLETVAEANKAEAARQEAVAAQALAYKDEANAEASRATSIAEKMKAIFN